MSTINRSVLTLIAGAMTLAVGPAWAKSDAERIAELEDKSTAMELELKALKAERAKEKKADSTGINSNARAALIEATQYGQRAEQAATEWKDSTSVTHLAGYASADYIDPDGGNSAFSANFNPMFHYMYGDRLLWESELAIELDEDGETEVELEYSTIDIFLNDNTILVAGKFLSPLGTFRQNLHPSWINKLASAPPGFGHDGAAPAADIGIQLRGGVNIFSDRKLTYAAYAANGPKLIGEGGEIHGIETEGVPSDADDSKIVGGRISFLPIPKLEIGVSGAFGDAAVVENDDVEIEGDAKRNYDVRGVDASYQWESLDLRGEYIMQDIADSSSSVAPEGGKWESWYMQAAYKFGQAKWESVVRYSDFNSPHADESQEQWMVGVNYLVAPAAMVKLGYEFNDGLEGEAVDSDRWMLQVAFGY